MYAIRSYYVVGLDDGGDAAVESDHLLLLVLLDVELPRQPVGIDGDQELRPEDLLEDPVGRRSGAGDDEVGAAGGQDISYNFV